MLPDQLKRGKKYLSTTATSKSEYKAQKKKNRLAWGTFEIVVLLLEPKKEIFSKKKLF